MNTKIAFLAATIAAAALPALGQGPDLSKLPPASTKTGVTFEKDILPLFKASCLRCHGEQRPRGGVQLDTLEHALKGGDDGEVIKPGKSAESDLVLAVAKLQTDPRKNMPPAPRPPRRGGPGAPGGAAGTNTPAGGPPGGPGGPGGNQPPPAKPLTPEEVGLVRAWIDQGAK